MNDWPLWLAIGGGGATGALLRGLIYRGFEKVSSASGDRFWGKYGSAPATLVVNILGSLIVGSLVGATPSLPPEWTESSRVFWTTGVCGALTTFATLCADVAGFARSGQRVRGAAVLAAHLILGISAFLLGLAIAA